ncbi:Histidine protein methyltransferase 1-like [Gracilariopsis chorda]|uniref:protein-histidine N-methyltransferase n=1 Tax=Gracilariopsis chorda TaxID=448386 RepID=A0A2V3J4V2_9FLOR|nr:Histidine protein methyltransferase 1-like [Gracilariopsis chorda]|eukprot:PXF49343.1 Histidine protein methyltransferase 1-like [Gracilariopsis chorda]
MAFKFNFGGAKDTDMEPRVAPLLNPVRDEPESHEITPHSQSSLRENAHDTVQLGDLQVFKSIATPSSSLSPAGSDIVPSVYEGGYKLWECAIDLAEYLRKASLCKGKSVLELGAGHAIPSIVAAMQDATVLCIQDYNEEVLRDVTIPNLTTNTSNVPVRYFAGGWKTLPYNLRRRFDIILSADTIYANQQCDSLADCICRTLEVGGLALIAAKKYYFGVGGGTAAFQEALRLHAKNQNISLRIRTVLEIRDGLSNIREIIEVQRE